MQVWQTHVAADLDGSGGRISRTLHNFRKGPATQSLFPKHTTRARLGRERLALVNMHALLAAVAVLGLHPAPAFRHPHSVFQPAAAWRTATVRTAAVRTATVRACAVEEAGIRVNKALRATHSRREADRLIDAGRVTVNAVAATSGDRLVRGDAVCLDGSPVDWERLNPPPAAAASAAADGGGGSRFIYLKYWKPRGVVCTTDRRQRGNILDELGPLPGVTDPTLALWPRRHRP